MVMLPVTVTQQMGQLQKNQFLVIRNIQKRPATEAPSSRFESAQNTTATGANQETFGFD
jgi:hypothetical protein